MRGATRRIKPRRHQNEISTHAPHAGSDLLGIGGCTARAISTHAPHAGSDLPLIRFVGFHGQFQPTLPMRGATFLLRFKRSLAIDFNPRSPCGERLSRARRGCGQRGYFNPRSPCGERQDFFVCHDVLYEFQPTLPMRGATMDAVRSSDNYDISTHAPHAGSD